MAETNTGTTATATVETPTKADRCAKMFPVGQCKGTRSPDSIYCPKCVAKMKASLKPTPDGTAITVDATEKDIKVGTAQTPVGAPVPDSMTDELPDLPERSVLGNPLLMPRNPGVIFSWGSLTRPNDFGKLCHRDAQVVAKIDDIDFSHPHTQAKRQDIISLSRPDGAIVIGDAILVKQRKDVYEKRIALNLEADKDQLQHGAASKLVNPTDGDVAHGGMRVDVDTSKIVTGEQTSPYHKHTGLATHAPPDVKGR